MVVANDVFQVTVKGEVLSFRSEDAELGWEAETHAELTADIVVRQRRVIKNRYGPSGVPASWPDGIYHLVPDHAYLSAGDTPYASGDQACTGCFLCGRSRKEHAS